MPTLDSLLQKDVVAKIVALLVAVALWVVVAADEQGAQRLRSGSGTMERVYSVAPRAQGLAKGLVLGEGPSTVQVRLRGTPAALDAAEAKVRVYLELAGMGEGEHLAQIKAHSGSGVEFVAVRPVNAVVQLEALESRTVRVAASVIGVPAGGFEAGWPRVSRAQVRVTGPQRRLALVRQVLAPADVEGRRTLTTLRAQLQPVDTLARTVPGVSVSPGTVLVTIPIRRGPLQ